MSIKPKNIKVYRRSRWSASWSRRTDWEPVSSEQTVSPKIGTAELRILYGKGSFPGGRQMKDAADASSYGDEYVKITADDTVWFVGVIPAEQFQIGGEARNIKTADQIIKAHSLEYLLETRMDGARVERGEGQAGGEPVDTEGEHVPVWIANLPVFNGRATDGSIAGNRSEKEYACDIHGKTYYIHVFGHSGELWSHYDILKYLLCVQQRIDDRLPFIDCWMPRDIKAMLSKMYGVFDFSQMTLRQAINTLINRSRGLCWFVETDDTDDPRIIVRSMIDRDLEVGDVIVPGHARNDRTKLDLWEKNERTTVNVTLDRSQQYDRIVARGEPIKVCGTWSLIDGSLVTGWTPELEQAYKDAAKNETGYADLTDDEKAELNDKFREAERFDRVYSTFVVPPTWGWTLNDVRLAGDAAIQNACPQWYRGQNKFDTAIKATYWNYGKRFLDEIPFKVGWDYSKGIGLSTSENAEGMAEEYRKPFVTLTQGGVRKFGEQLTVPATLRLLPDQMGIDVRIKPAYLMAGTSFADAEPGVHSDEMVTQGTGFALMRLTATVVTDQLFELAADLRKRQGPRTLVIEVPRAELVYVVPGTVCDLSNGQEVFYDGEADIRNDSDKLMEILAAAVSWYSRKKVKLQIVAEHLTRISRLGRMIEHVDLSAGNIDDADGSVVTAIKFDYAGDRTVITTDHAELDLGGLFRGGGNSSGSSSPSTPNLSVAARKLEKLTAKQDKLAAAIAKRPVRQPQPPPVRIQRAQCTANAGTGKTITASLYDSSGQVIGTGSGCNITVNCSVVGTANLSEAAPRLTSGTDIFVIKVPTADGPQWYCTTIFQATQDCS